MNKRPTLPKVRNLGGGEFESLMHQLLLAYAEKHSFAYEPHGVNGAGDQGIDGLALGGGGPGLKGATGFQCKWLTGNLSRGDNAKQIKASLAEAANSEFKLKHWVLVTPEPITPAQKKWLQDQSPRKGLTVHHWGHEQISSLFTLRPDLDAQYYPETASRLTGKIADDKACPPSSSGNARPATRTEGSIPGAKDRWTRISMATWTRPAWNAPARWDCFRPAARSVVPWTWRAMSGNGAPPLTKDRTWNARSLNRKGMPPARCAAALRTSTFTSHAARTALGSVPATAARAPAFVWWRPHSSLSPEFSDLCLQILGLDPGGPGVKIRIFSDRLSPPGKPPRFPRRRLAKARKSFRLKAELRPEYRL